VEGDQEGGGLGDLELRRHREAEVVERQRLLRERAVADEEARDRHHARADGRARAGAGSGHDPRQLLARREGELRREQVAAATHQHVGETERRGVDAHAQEARARLGRRRLAQRERLLRRAVAHDLPGAHLPDHLQAERYALLEQ
jgi:hypothetical protein